tara:strand:+ start:579 stop:983 length:405 start_codon:yes stop_codon:yes gene_type:complete
MIREKVIAITLIIVSSIVLIESISAWSTDHNLFLENSVKENIALNGIIEDKNSFPALLQGNSWGEDIFYDRSNIYNSWFKLTGITQFEGGFKAIINGQIVHEYDRVRGFRVIKIIENQVVLERDQYSVKLKLEK